MDAVEILEGQTIVLKRGRLNGLGFEPAFNSYFDFYASTKYISPSLLQLEDISFHLYLRKNLNDQNPRWQMPTIRQMRKKFGMGQTKLEGMMRRLEEAHLLKKISGQTGDWVVRNGYVLSDPIQTLEEFLTVAREGAFPRPLNSEWLPCTQNGYTAYPNQVHERVPKTGTDQQTLTTEQTVWDRVLEQLKTSLPQNTFAAFLEGTDLLSVVDGVATIHIDKPHAIDWLSNRMGSKLPRMIETELRLLNDSRTVSELNFDFV
jgi:hypothetical protein